MRPAPRTALAACLALFSAACSNLRDIEDAKLPLLNHRVTPPNGRFIGRLFVRNVPTYSGCTSPPTKQAWMVLESDGHTLPIKQVGRDPLAAIIADEQTALKLATPISTAADLRALHIAAGSQVSVEGALAPLFWSGTVAMQPVYGLCASKIEPDALPDERR